MIHVNDDCIKKPLHQKGGEEAPQRRRTPALHRRPYRAYSSYSRCTEKKKRPARQKDRPKRRGSLFNFFLLLFDNIHTVHTYMHFSVGLPTYPVEGFGGPELFFLRSLIRGNGKKWEKLLSRQPQFPGTTTQ
ncbi:hypothetical protein MAPG_09946 [Magnaporthiopsis poae ATCC 64411]|uniref:Uncharacterized protein n=1 Tax=Magnaporthiopsis poae (strain ATCC 64411 / 73-15) TaxID=644358 RepID=A0A0C4EB99_MAGP6|nr:hypothetical protein MAPG_09946 [Magnaporthiopsis poae ATCC 64411]